MAKKKEEYGDLDLLKLFSTRDAWDKYRNFVQTSAVIEETWIILSGIDEYYTGHPASTELDWKMFRSRFMLKISSGLTKHRASIIAGILDAIITDPKPSSKQEELVEFFVDMYYASEIEKHVAEILGGKNKGLSDVADMLAKHETEKAAISHTDMDKWLLPADFVGTYDRIFRSGGIEWRLEDLNVSVGPIHYGDLVCVTACPNVGKTRFVTSEITYMLPRLPEDDRRILIVNNEETADSIWNAIYSSYFNKTDDEVLKNVAKYAAEWDKGVDKNSIRILQDSSATTRDIERAIKIYRPKVVVFNQLYKTHLPRMSKATEAEQYRQVYQFARNMADKYKLAAIAVHQAGAAAAGEKWITQEQMYGSKTGVAGECDVIIGIGKTYDPREKDHRYINIIRNKLPSGPRTIASLREDSHFEVKFKAGHGRYETIEYT